MARKQALVADTYREPKAPCGWVDCRHDAMVRVQTQKGWLHLCVPHYDDYWRAKPAYQGAPNGWEDWDWRDKTYETYRARWYKERKLPYEPPKRGLKLQLPTRRDREPGSDDEYAYSST